MLVSVTMSCRSCRCCDGFTRLPPPSRLTVFTRHFEIYRKVHGEISETLNNISLRNILSKYPQMNPTSMIGCCVFNEMHRVNMWTWALLADTSWFLVPKLQMGWFETIQEP